MNLQQYILIFFFGTVISTVAWLLIIFNIDPVAVGVPAHIFFYVSLGISLTGLFTTLLTVVRSLLFHQDVDHAVFTSLRQAILFTVLITGTLIMLASDILTWWLLILFVFVVAVIEFFFLSLHSE